MKKTIGFIGMGNMAQAIAQGFISSGKLTADQLNAYAPNQDKLKRNAERIGFTACASAADVVMASDIVIMSCKPYQIESVLKEIAPLLPGKVLLSIALGWDHARYQEHLQPNTRVQFIMPNTPAQTGQGVLLFEGTHSLETDERTEIMELFSSLGLVRELPSHLMGIGGAITGCGPAFVDLFIEAFADAAVKYGIQRPLAYELVSQMILGSAQLQLATGKHPGQLKDEVCSPGGSTIRGVEALEKNGLRAVCMSAVEAIMNNDH